jgi:polyisoprenyl-teichoic acid--peptidoglycan teichoic acid transferase
MGADYTGGLVMDPPQMTSGERRARRSPVIAALLSFVWPGLGQWYVGRPRSALIFAIPVGVLVVVLGLWLAGGLAQAFVGLLAPSLAVTFIVIVILEGAWRIGAIVHAATVGLGRDRTRRRYVTVGFPTLILILLVAGSHLWAVSVAWSLHEASGQIFVGVGPPVASPPPGGSAAPSADGFDATPAVTPATPASRITILLTGIDSSETRTHALTDTLIVLTVDPITSKAAMISIPRDVARFKLWDGRMFTGKINSLLTYANNHPTEFPEGGLPTLIHELSFLLGTPIHYYAAVDLQGFVKLVDAVGGVTIDNPREIDDPGYGGWTDGRVGFVLSAGVHKLDGQTALAYARSRKGIGDNDFTRARRQQQLLVALRDRVTDPSLLLKLPSIIATASELLRTNFPEDRVSEMLTLGQKITGNDLTKQVVLGPPYAINPPPGTPGGYQLILDMNRVAKLSVDLFGADSSYASTGTTTTP